VRQIVHRKEIAERRHAKREAESKAFWTLNELSNAEAFAAGATYMVAVLLWMEERLGQRP
jgi:hypothetical protein